MKNMKLGVAVLCALCAALPLTSDASTAGQLAIYMIDVAQGDATLIVGPNGTTVLVDSGQYSFAAGQILSLLAELGITHLDYAIATHFDSDHLSNFCNVFAAIGTPAVVYDRGGTRCASAVSTTPKFFASYVNCAGSARRQLKVGASIALGDYAKIRVLAAGDPDYLGATSDYQNLWTGTRLACANNENEKSLSLLVSYGSFDFLLSGDLTGVADPPNQCSDDRLNVEGPVATIVKSTLRRKVDVLRLDHHGSETTGNQLAYLQKLAPKVAAISVGDDPSCGEGFNGYAHPGQLTLDGLYSVGVQKIYQTEEGGASYRNTPSPCTPAPGQTYPRNYHGLPHDYLYGSHVRITSDGKYFKIKNALGQLDAYTAY